MQLSHSRIIFFVALLFLSACKPSITGLGGETPTHVAPTATPVREATPDPTVVLILEEISSGEEQGDRIIEAIERYSQSTGHYPQSLENLVPEFINAIPVTMTGKKFFYRLDESDICVVGFDLARKAHAACSYSRRLDAWDCEIGWTP